MSDDNFNPKNWAEYGSQVLYRLEFLTKKIEELEKENAKAHNEMNDKLNAIKMDIAIIKTKAAVYGAIGGFVISALFSLLIAYLKNA